MKQKAATVMELSADQLGTLITLGAAAAGSIIVILVNCIQGSRCTTIRLCFGCFHCIRELPETEGGGGEESEQATPDASTNDTVAP